MSLVQSAASTRNSSQVSPPSAVRLRKLTGEEASAVRRSVSTWKCLGSFSSAATCTPHEQAQRRCPASTNDQRRKPNLAESSTNERHHLRVLLGGVHLIVLEDVLELAVHLKSKEEVVPEQRMIINEGRRTILDASLGAHDHLRRREDPPHAGHVLLWLEHEERVDVGAAVLHHEGCHPSIVFAVDGRHHGVVESTVYDRHWLEELIHLHVRQQHNPERKSSP